MQRKVHDLGEVGSSVVFDIKHNKWSKILASAQGEVSEVGGKLGPEFGRYDLYVGLESYMFCMFLPGVDLKQGKIFQSCHGGYSLNYGNGECFPLKNVSFVSII